MKVMLLGSNGQLGRELERQLSNVSIISAFTRSSLDITDHSAVKDAIRCVRPNIIVNAAAYTAVDKAEKDSDTVFAINAEAVAHLAHVAKADNAWLIHYSTDYVFDGTKSAPYTEIDTPNPINVYGASKLAGEQAIISTGCQYLIFRTTWVIGKDGSNFAKTILRLATDHQSLNVISDQFGVPTSTSLITHVTIDAIQSIENNCAWPLGIYHLAPHGVSNWYEIAQTLVNFAEQHSVPLIASAHDIKPISATEYPTAAQRPLNSQLDISKLRARLTFNLPHWKDDFLVVASSIIKELQTA